MTVMTLSNLLWRADVGAPAQGRVVYLASPGDTPVVAVVVPGADHVAEGGHAPFFGLESWIKTGDHPDPNTGVLSAFAPLHEVPRQTRADGDRVIAESAAEGLRFRLEWRLPAGREPLVCTARLENTDAPPAPYQFEFFFLWTIPATEWAATALALPGLPPRRLSPYGEIVFVGSQDAATPACWWRVGSTHGVALRAEQGCARFFYGIQNPSFVLGLHSEKQVVGPGQTLTCRFALAPLTHAVAAGWLPDHERVAATVAQADQDLAALVSRFATLRDWAPPGPATALPKRAVHLTLQYAPVNLEDTKRVITEVLAPLGYNQLMIEVGRAFPYRTHPEVAASWAYSRATWRDLLATAQSVGLEVIPEYNSLGHQGESGLAVVYPELREDPDGWVLNPEHPHTIPWLCDLFGELLEVFEPPLFHIGLDEVDVPHRPPTFGMPKPGRQRDGAQLFAMHINGLHEYLKRQGVGCLMWPDMLLHRPEYGFTHGARAGTWRAIADLPRDIIMMDWQYQLVPRYAGSEYLRDQGFRVMGAIWHKPETIPPLSQFIAANGLYGMCATTWCAAELHHLPLLCLLVGGRYFSNPRTGPWDTVLAEARALAQRLAGR